MARSILQQSLHNTMVSNQVATYRRAGHFGIRADHIGHIGGAPDDYLGHRPDVTSYINGTLIICEVETGDSITTEETVRQIHAFRQAANQLGALLHIVVPASALKTAQRVLDAYKIRVDHWWYLADH